MNEECLVYTRIYQEVHIKIKLKDAYFGSKYFAIHAPWIFWRGIVYNDKLYHHKMNETSFVRQDG